MESVWSVSKLTTESVGSRRELVANCVHNADATQLDSFVASASAVCIGHYDRCDISKTRVLQVTKFGTDVHHHRRKIIPVLTFQRSRSKFKVKPPY